MKTLLELQTELRAKAEELKVLSAKEDYSAEDDKVAEGIKAELAKLDAEIKVRMSRDANTELAGTYEEFLASNEPTQPVPQETAPAPVAQLGQTPAVITQAATFPRVALSNITGVKNGKDAHQRAADFGMWALAAIGGNAKALDYCKKRNIEMLGANENENIKGAFFIPDQVSTDIIDLRAQYGVFRRYARIEDMVSDSKTINVRKDGLTVYPIGETEAPTESELTWDQVTLLAKKWGVLASASEDFNMDFIISWADKATGEAAYAFAKNEDQVGFNGDGSSTYHKMWGLGPKLKSLDATPANVASIVVGSGNAYSELVMSDFSKMKAKVPTYAYDRGGLAFFCSSAFYYDVMEPLKLAAGGNNAADITNGNNTERFMGFPVVFTEAMPSTAVNSQICCYFGSLSLAVLFGDRRGVALSISDQVRFLTGELVMRGIERFDVNFWNTGNATSTVADQVAGPLIALELAAS